MKLLRWIPLGLLAVAAASANAITYTLNATSGGYNYKATAQFSLTGTALQIILTNTQTSGTPSNAQVLTGLFWNIDAGQSLTLSGASATVNGSIIGTPHQNHVGDVAPQHWAWRQNAVTGNANYGIGAAGFGYFEHQNSLLGTMFQSGGGNPILDGVDWGIIGTSQNLGAQTSPWVLNSMIFNFTVNSDFELADIGNVYFQYGSSFTEFRGEGNEELPPSEVVPEPASMAMAGFAAVAAIAGRRRAKAAKK